ERDVLADALDHALGRPPDAVRLETRTHVAAVDPADALERRPRAVLRLGDHDEALLRHLDGRGIAADLRAAAPERLDLRAELALRDGEVVPHVGMAGRDAHEHALAATADEERWTADRLRLADRVPYGHVATLERHPLLAPEPAEDRGGLGERPAA